MCNTDDYYNFPIQLIHNLFHDTENCFTNIINYSVYFDFKKSGLLDYSSFVTSKHSHCIIELDKCLGQQLNDSLEREGLTGIKHESVKNYLSFEIDTKSLVKLSVHLAWKSIIGTKKYIKTNNSLLIARMHGVISSNNNYKLNPLISEYKNSKYKISKLKRSACDSFEWTYSSYHSRGYYISNKISLKQLIKIEENNRPKNKEKNRKLKEKELRKEVLEEISKPNDSTDLSPIKELESFKPFQRPYIVPKEINEYREEENLKKRERDAKKLLDELYKS